MPPSWVELFEGGCPIRHLLVAGETHTLLIHLAVAGETRGIHTHTPDVPAVDLAAEGAFSPALDTKSVVLTCMPEKKAEWESELDRLRSAVDELHKQVYTLQEYILKRELTV